MGENRRGTKRSVDKSSDAVIVALETLEKKHHGTPAGAAVGRALFIVGVVHPAQQDGSGSESGGRTGGEGSEKAKRDKAETRSTDGPKGTQISRMWQRAAQSVAKVANPSDGLVFAQRALGQGLTYYQAVCQLLANKFERERPQGGYRGHQDATARVVFTNAATGKEDPDELVHLIACVSNTVRFSVSHALLELKPCGWDAWLSSRRLPPARSLCADGVTGAEGPEDGIAEDVAYLTAVPECCYCINNNYV